MKSLWLMSGAIAGLLILPGCGDRPGYERRTIQTIGLGEAEHVRCDMITPADFWSYPLYRCTPLDGGSSEAR
jgi:hypothetical protein